jgi:cytochrome c oxidase subunit 3
VTQWRAARAGFEVLGNEAVLRHGGGGPTAVRQPPVANAMLAVVLFMTAEVMLFTGLLGAFVLYRTSSPVWPPPGQPLLPIGLTLANSVALLLSAVSMHRAVSAVRTGDLAGLRRGLLLTAILGLGFVLVQGYEWVNLVAHGLTLSSSTYGATFYTLIGLHAAHVLGAAFWLLAVLGLAWRGRYGPENHVGVQVCAVYWYFVCGLWAVLFGLVYLA